MQCSAHPRVLGEAAEKAGELLEHGSKSLGLFEVVLGLEDLVHGLDRVVVLEALKMRTVNMAWRRGGSGSGSQKPHCSNSEPEHILTWRTAVGLPGTLSQRENLCFRMCPSRYSATASSPFARHLAKNNSSCDGKGGGSEQHRDAYQGWVKG